MDNIIITTHDALGNDHKGDTMRLHGKQVPGGFAGYVPQDAGFAVCHECALEHYDDELKTDKGGLIMATSESDYPGMMCEDCQTWIDTNLLVYKGQDPKLHFRLRMTEELGGRPHTEEVYSIEEIADKARQEAYELGYADAEPIAGEFGDGGEYEDDHVEVPTDSARWANHIAPNLRSLAGFEDSGHGTFQEIPIDVVSMIHSEDVVPAYRAGYRDCAIGRGIDANYP